ncbi:MAG: hypothetical protein HeimC3_34810, partial [Candidatus Heimdallarchaeota archaeon LC_3]
MQLIETNTALILGLAALSIPVIIEIMRKRESKRIQTIELRKKLSDILIKMITEVSTCVMQIPSDEFIKDEPQLEEKVIESVFRIMSYYYELMGILTTYGNTYKMDKKHLEKDIGDIESSMGNEIETILRYKHYKKISNKEFKE